MAQPKERRLLTEAALESYENVELPKKFVPVSRGVVSVPTDANEYRAAAQVGAYTIRASNLTNGPAFDGDPLVTFSVLARNGSNAITQLAVSATQMFWRNARNSTVWEPWQEVGAAPVVSLDKTVPLSEGQILIVPDMSSGMTTFENYPTGFQRYWSPSSNEWGANDLPSLLGGRGVRFKGNQRAMTTWTEFAGMTEGDVLARMVMDSIPTHQAGGVIIRASGGRETLNGYLAYVAEVDGEPQLGLGDWSGGSGTALGRVPFPIQAGEPFWIRFNIRGGDTLSVKAWKDGDPEPDGWMLTDFRSTPHTGGAVGLFHNSTGGVQMAWDVLSISQGGGQA